MPPSAVVENMGGDTLPLSVVAENVGEDGASMSTESIKVTMSASLSKMADRVADEGRISFIYSR